MLNKPSLFITGGSGLLAVNWALLMRDRYNVNLNLHRRIIKPTGVKILTTKLGSVDEILEELNILRPEAIVHTAGLTNVETCEEDPKLANLVNVELSSNIAKASKLLRIPLVYISTDHLYRGTNSHTTELEPTAPLNVYGYTKAEAENDVLMNNGSALVIRTNFYAWGPSYRQSFSDRIIDALRRKQEIVLFKDVYYTPILAEALILTVHELLEKKAKGIFNIVSDDRISKFDFGIMIAKEFGLDLKYIKPGYIRANSALVNRPADMSLSNNKVRGLLGRKIGTVADQIKRLHDQELEGIVKEIQLL